MLHCESFESIWQIFCTFKEKFNCNQYLPNINFFLFCFVFCYKHKLKTY